MSVDNPVENTVQFEVDDGFILVDGGSDLPEDVEKWLDSNGIKP